MAIFSDNKQSLYAIFQYVLTTPIYRKTTSLSLKRILQNCYTAG